MKKVRTCALLFAIWTQCGVHCCYAGLKGALLGAFVKDTDYILLTPQVKQTDYARGGHNKEIIMLNIVT
jgi:hypothetical protein